MIEVARAWHPDRYGKTLEVSGRLEVAPVVQDAAQLRAERAALVRQMLAEMSPR